MNDITVEEKQALWLEENGIKPELWSALQSSIFPGAKPASIKLAYDYCAARKLDIMKKPVHIVPMYIEDKKTGQKGMRDVVMPGIYELRITAVRTGQFAGEDPPIFGDNIDYNGVTAPEFCTVTVYRILHGEKCGFSHTEYFAEACSTKKDGKPNAMWSKRPRGQLSKCAEAGALRKAFPDEFGGIMTADEVQGAIIDSGIKDITPKKEKENINEQLLG